MTTTHPIRRGRRYRRLFFGLIAIGVVSFIVGIRIGQTTAGLLVYVGTALGAFATMVFVRFRSSAIMWDERDQALERRASHLTFQLFGYLGWFVFVALFLLDATDERAFAQPETTLLYAYATITLSWGAIYLGLRFRR